MTRLTAKDFAPELLELYDYYAHGKINRREFLDRAALFTFGGLTAGAPNQGPGDAALRRRGSGRWGGLKVSGLNKSPRPARLAPSRASPLPQGPGRNTCL